MVNDGYWGRITAQYASGLSESGSRAQKAQCNECNFHIDSVLGNPQWTRPPEAFPQSSYQIETDDDRLAGPFGRQGATICTFVEKLWGKQIPGKEMQIRVC
jgi:hypothetical protein